MIPLRNELPCNLYRMNPHRYVVGFTYIAAYCVVLIGYLTILGAPFALVVWIAMRWCVCAAPLLFLFSSRS